MMLNSSKYLKGEYVFIKDGNEFYRSQNIVTDSGKTVIAEYLSGQSKSYASSIVLGAGSSTATAADNSLDFELGAIPIEFKTIDATKDPIQIVFRGTVSASFVGKIYEAGLISGSTVSLSGTSDIDDNPEIIATFNTDFEEWDTTDPYVDVYSNSTGTPSNVCRVGGSGLKFTVPSSTTSSSSITLPVVVNYYSSSALINVAFHCDAAPSSIEIKMSADESNYYTATIDSAEISAGYNIINIPLSSLVKTGTIETNEILSVEVSVTTTGSVSTVVFDGIRFSEPLASQSNILVSRSVLSEPLDIDGGYPFDIEYRVGFNI